MNILVSACLLGVCCRYDGRRIEPSAAILELMRRHTLIPVCPEAYGGMTTPRPPSERREGGVYSVDGADVTENYRRGAEEALRLARLYGCRYALLKERSPACGSGRIYDGSFTGTLTDGDGVAAELLLKNGVRVLGESRIEELYDMRT